MKTLFLNPPSYSGFDGGAGSRYQARREIHSFWYPTWLAVPAGLIPQSKLIDAPAESYDLDTTLRMAFDFDLIVIHTSTPSLYNDAGLAEKLKDKKKELLIGFVGPHPTVLPENTLRCSKAIDFVARGEFDYTIKDIAEGKPLSTVDGISYQKDGEILHNADRQFIEDLDNLPFAVDVYHRDLKVENYSIGYLKYPYLSFYTGRGCTSRCTFCLWPQTIGGHRYRVRSTESVYEEIKLAKRYFPQVKEIFFDDDTFTSNIPRALAIAEKLASLEVTWSCNAKANLPYDVLKQLKRCGLRLLLVGYESGNQEILNRVKKGINLDVAREFTKNCKRLGITVHGTFVLGLPVESPKTIEDSIKFACEIDPDTIQVSLVAPYPGTTLYEEAREKGWLIQDPMVSQNGIQNCVLEYPELSSEDIYHSLEHFYKRFYFRPKPILRMLKIMARDPLERKRRIKDGLDFLKFLNRRKSDK